MECSIARITPHLLPHRFPTEKLSQREKVLLRCIRNAMIAIMLLLYGHALSELDGQRDLMSASWNEIMGELHPDSPKNAERLTEGEVVPKWNTYLHADDVTKHLNWMQMFCMNKHGMDDHIGFFWDCNILRVHVKYDANVLPSDPNMNCSKEFIKRHIKDGDNTMLVPWGESSIEELATLAGGGSKVGQVNPLYDEFTVLDGNPMWEHVDALGDRLQEIERAMQEYVESRSNSTDARLTDIYQAVRNISRQVPLTSARRKLSGHTGTPELGMFCWRPRMNIKNNTQDMKSAAPGNETHVLRSTCRNHHWGLVQLCQPQVIQVDFHIERVDRVCKGCDDWKKAKRMLYFNLALRFDNLAGKKHLYGSSADWYRASLSLHEGEVNGLKDAWDGLSAILSLFLLIPFFVLELLYTAVTLPWNVMRFVQLCRSAGDWDDRNALRSAFSQLLAVTVDGRGSRAMYLSSSAVACEQLAAIFIFNGFIQSYYNSDHDLPTNLWDDKSGSKSLFLTNLPFEQQMSEIVYAIFFDMTIYHSFAWFLLFLRLVFSIGRWKSVQWFTDMFELGLTRLIVFFMLHSLLVAGFALVMMIQFGARYVQFHSWQRAMWELELLACGSPNMVFDNIVPFEDNKSAQASCFLLCYVIFTLTVAINVFTTIILDAYSLSCNPHTAAEHRAELKQLFFDNFMALLQRDACDGTDPVEIELGEAASTAGLRGRRSTHRHNGAEPFFASWR
eukprot:TRINITY_DN25560_c0_g1_i1.p1 TRINITY_DN25560_c0_g1~~TRINITY_DN25560_c0_g1_i1.p1  ORF type:complete len:730 (+),score=105.08 TRINITY_DN25560_c0_g1_i1:102-2291(+)